MLGGDEEDAGAPGRLAESSQLQHDQSVFPPPAAMFAIPTHATTHASAPSVDPSDEDTEDHYTLQGRPMPTTVMPLDPQPRLYDQTMTNDQATSLPPFSSTEGTAAGGAIAYGSQNAEQVLEQSFMQGVSNLQIHQRSEAPPPQPLPRLRTDNIHSSAAQYVNSASTMQNEQQNSSPSQYDRPPPRYRRGRFNLAADLPPARELPNSPDAPSPAPGGRFPRWRGWLEKRALERHYDQLDRDMAGLESEQQHPATSEGEVLRKKSWGAGVHDTDAVSESTIQDEDMPLRRGGPLHLYHFGSRFIPHIPSLPLCAVFLDLPPAHTWSTARLLRRNTPEESKRRVLLVGTQDGLYAVEMRRETRSDDLTSADSLQRKERGSAADVKQMEVGQGRWNGNIRVCQIWSGVGIYQMSVLSPQLPDVDARSSLYGFAPKTTSDPDPGIVLALCSSKKDHSKLNPTYGSTHFGSHGDLNQTLNAASTATSSRSGLSSTYFGTGGGGGKNKASPPHGSGDVRMWSTEAIRRIVVHVLDSSDHRPLDMLQKSRSSRRANMKTSTIGSRIRKAWAQLGESSGDRKRTSRQYSSKASPVSPPAVDSTPMRFSFSADESHPAKAAPPFKHARSQSEQLLANSQMYMSSTVRPASPVEEVPQNGPHQECLRLAQSWVPIALPGMSPYATNGTPGQTESVTSLYSDDLHSGAGGSGSTHGHGSSPIPPSSHSGKGISFYAIVEAGPEVQGAGTWYLALAQGKSILLYESVKPISRGDTRSWAFVKEFYTPVAPKAINFCFSESPDPDEVARSSFSSPSGVGSSSAKRNGKTHRSVKSSSYSSVFRSHPSLTLFVSLGKKAVLIRASDASVREVDLLSVSHPIGEYDLQAGTSDLGHYVNAKSSQGHSTASGTLVRRLSDAPENSLGHNKESWVGLERVTAQVMIRCKSAALSEDPGQGANRNKLENDDEDEDDEDDEDDWENERVRAGDKGITHSGVRGVTLHDTPPNHAGSGTGGVSSILRRSLRSRFPTYTIFAGMVVLTKGNESHVLPSPLSRDMVQPRPLQTLVWSASPTSVSASARVIGLERDLSSGPVPVDSLGRSKRVSQLPLPSSSPDAASKSNSVILHVVIALLATLPSRIEMKRVRVRLPIRMPFAFRRDSELELEPFMLPTPAASGAEEEADDGLVEAHQELEYLCGMLSPTHYDQLSTKPWEAAGDGGAWMFDWRGADDFRVFYAASQI